jgi:hypothetical protein
MCKCPTHGSPPQPLEGGRRPDSVSLRYARSTGHTPRVWTCAGKGTSEAEPARALAASRAQSLPAHSAPPITVATAMTHSTSALASSRLYLPRRPPSTLTTLQALHGMASGAILRPLLERGRTVAGMPIAAPSGSIVPQGCATLQRSTLKATATLVMLVC